ncbi:MAG TPA: PRC-barrel domain-containing protein [Stellaceae bacterium]|nr:PRC-barrel domain-containing protein [Stellaceae bacterium]
MQSDMTGVAGTAVATDETDRLIASDKVEGTAVYNRQGERLGKVYNFMIDKYTGRVAYAVMSFGGFLGVGESYHPLPWKVLTYDTRLGGYVVDLDRIRLEGAPSYTSSTLPNWSDQSYRRRIDEYYGMPYSAHDKDLNEIITQGAV